MKRIICAFCFPAFLFISNIKVSAQPVVAGESAHDPASISQPEFPGGTQALMQFISRNLNYPGEAVEYGVEGKIIAQFVIDKEGNLKDAKILHGLGHGCDEEVLRVLALSPKWKPGKHKDEAISMRYQLPVVFRLQDTSDEAEEAIEEGY